MSAGRYADLIAVTGNPLHDIAVLKTIDVVLKGGDVVKDARVESKNRAVGVSK